MTDGDIASFFIEKKLSDVTIMSPRLGSFSFMAKKCENQLQFFSSNQLRSNKNVTQFCLSYSDNTEMFCLELKCTTVPISGALVATRHMTETVMTVHVTLQCQDDMEVLVIGYQ